MSGRGSDRRWRARRAQVLARDGYRCQVRGPACAGTATDAGHVVAVIDGGTDDLSNLRAECAPCNRGAGATLGNRRRQLGGIDTTW